MHSDGWWRKRVVGWEDQGAPILTAMVWCVLGTCDNVMPPAVRVSIQWSNGAWTRSADLLEDIGVGRVSCDVRRRVF